MGPWAPCCSSTISRLRISADLALEGCNENLVLTRPDVILGIHARIYAAGADIVETNTFNAHGFSRPNTTSAHKAHEINRTAAQLARQAADEFSTPAKPRFVAGSMGPTTSSITVARNVTFELLGQAYYVQAKALIEGGADILLVETARTRATSRPALLAIERLERELGFAIPMMVSGTIETMGTMLAGQTADALYASIAHADLLSVGLNCATGPEFMTDHIRTLARDGAPRDFLLSRTPGCPTRRASIWRRPSHWPRSSSGSSTTAG